MARFKPPKSRDAAWGIDFGAASLKAVRVSLVQTGKRSPATVRVDDVVEVPLEGPAIECDQPRDPRAAGEAAAFDRLRSERNISDECLVLGLPGVQSLLRTFPLPPGRPERLAEAIHYEVRGSVPLGEHELVYGSRRAATARAENNGSNPTVPVVAVAASRTHVNGRLAWLGDLATPSTIVQSSCVALLNALRFAAPSGGNGRDQPVQSYAIIDLGAETLNMVVDEGDLFWFRSSYGGMKPLNEALAQQLQLTHQQAAQLRQRPVAAHRMHLADAILRPGFEHLLQAVRRALDQNQRERNGCVATAYLCGGGASQFGLLRHFWFGG
jgi:Tfp pilus assembly PilM family ATPase